MFCIVQVLLVPHSRGFFSLQQLLCVLITGKVYTTEAVWENLLGVWFSLKDALVTRDCETSWSLPSTGVGGKGEEGGPGEALSKASN